jgi:hypothetical protein
MVIQQMKRIGTLCNDLNRVFQWKNEAVEFLKSFNEEKDFSFYLLDCFLTHLIFTKFANKLVVENEKYSLLNLVLIEFGEINWRTTDLCLFFIYVFYIWDTH